MALARCRLATRHLDLVRNRTQHVNADGTEVFWPYVRDENLARDIALPAPRPHASHRWHRKEDGSGNISYEPENHSHMVHLRAQRVAYIANDIPDAVLEGDEDAEVLVVGWGSTWGAITAAVNRARDEGLKVARVHLVHLNPFPKNFGDLLRKYPSAGAEMNLGQLVKMIRSEFLVDAKAISKVMGQPFSTSELYLAISGAIND